MVMKFNQYVRFLFLKSILFIALIDWVIDWMGCWWTDGRTDGMGSWFLSTVSLTCSLVGLSSGNFVVPVSSSTSICSCPTSSRDCYGPSPTPSSWPTTTSPAVTRYVHTDKHTDTPTNTLTNRLTWLHTHLTANYIAFIHGQEFDLALNPIISTPWAKMTMHRQNIACIVYCVVLLCSKVNTFPEHKLVLLEIQQSVRFFPRYCNGQ